jgi:transcriptional regulator with XRE-family HTH domain
MDATLSYKYGGWVPERGTATGVTSTVVRLVGWVAAAGAALAAVGTGGELSIEHRAPTIEVAEVELVRTPTENLTRIREVLNPAVSDLATTFGVSRQSIYNWLNGDPVADENAAKLQDLAQAADVLAHEGVTVNAALLKRKFASGRTLLQVAQRERMSARFANRPRTAPTADFDLPASNDQV